MTVVSLCIRMSVRLSATRTLSITDEGGLARSLHHLGFYMHAATSVFGFFTPYCVKECMIGQILLLLNHPCWVRRPTSHYSGVSHALADHHYMVYAFGDKRSDGHERRIMLPCDHDLIVLFSVDPSFSAPPIMAHPLRQSDSETI